MLITPFFLSCYRLKKIKFGQEIFYGATPDDVPYVQLSPLDEDVIVSYTGPDNGLIFAETSAENSELVFCLFFHLGKKITLMAASTFHHDMNVKQTPLPKKKQQPHLCSCTYVYGSNRTSLSADYATLLNTQIHSTLNLMLMMDMNRLKFSNMNWTTE